MDNFVLIYNILKKLEAALDYDEFDIDYISYKNLDVTKNRWKNIIEMLHNEGYVSGVMIVKSMDGSLIMDIKNIKITLKGLEYLAENTILKKAHRIAKGIKDLPFIP